MKTLKAAASILIFAFMLCFAGNINAQGFDDAIGSTVKVNHKSAKPNVFEFFAAYAQWRTATPANDMSDGIIKDARSYICLNKPMHTDVQNGKTSVFDKKKIDTANGYLQYENGGTPALKVECCYWNTADRKKIIFAVNYTCEALGSPVTEHLDCFEYDNSTSTMRKILPPCNIMYPSQAWTDRFSVTEMRSVVFRLPQKGKNIIVEIAGVNEQGDKTDLNEVWKWNGYGFTIDYVENANAYIESPEAIDIYDVSGGKVVNSITESRIDIGLSLLGKTESMYYVRAELWTEDEATNGKIYYGWINRSSNIEIGTRNYDGSELVLYNISDNGKTPICTEIKSDVRCKVIDFMIDDYGTKTGVKGAWLKVQIKHNGKTIEGWLSPDMQCAASQTNCN